MTALRPVCAPRRVPSADVLRHAAGEDARPCTRAMRDARRGEHARATRRRRHQWIVGETRELTVSLLPCRARSEREWKGGRGGEESGEREREGARVGRETGRDTSGDWRRCARLHARAVSVRGGIAEMFSRTLSFIRRRSRSLVDDV